MGLACTHLANIEGKLETLIGFAGNIGKQLKVCSRRRSL
jgi:hypothetical protein